MSQLHPLAPAELLHFAVQGYWRPTDDASDPVGTVVGTVDDWDYKLAVAGDGRVWAQGVDAEDGEILEYRDGRWTSTGRNASDETK